MHRLDEETGQSGVKREVIDGDDGLTCSSEVPRVEVQAVTGNFEPAKNRDVYVIQFHAAIETRAESIGNASFQNRTGAMDHHFSDGQKRQQNDERDDSDPSPNAFSRIRCAVGRRMVVGSLQNFCSHLFTSLPEAAFLCGVFQHR